MKHVFPKFWRPVKPFLAPGGKSLMLVKRATLFSRELPAFVFDSLVKNHELAK